MSRPRSARPLLVVAVGLGAAAALLWGAVAAPWPGAVPSWPTGVAWLALAGVAGMAATSGVVRRLVGCLLALAGLAATAAAVVAVIGGGSGPWLALAGAVVAVAAGAYGVVHEPRMVRFGARYARKGVQQTDPDRAAWQDLDEGRDPTA